MTCRAPIPLVALVDYAGGVAEDLALEDHVFDCDFCAHRLDVAHALIRAVGGVVRRAGGAQLLLTPAALQRLEQDGVRIRRYDARPGDVVPCTIGAVDDLLVTVMTPPESAGVDGVDLDLRVHGNVVVHFADAPVVGGTIVYTLAGDVARTFPSTTIDAELFAHGTRRSLATYRFVHTQFRS